MLFYTPQHHACLYGSPAPNLCNPRHWKHWLKNVDVRGEGSRGWKKKNTAAVLREARGRPPRPRLSSTLISGSRVPSASSVEWCAEARECGSSLLHAGRTSREAKKKNIEKRGGQREKQEGRKATGRHGLCPHTPSTQHPHFIHFLDTSLSKHCHRNKGQSCNISTEYNTRKMMQPKETRIKRKPISWSQLYVNQRTLTAWQGSLSRCCERLWKDDQRIRDVMWNT